MTRRKVVNKKFAKIPEYKKVLETIESIGACPFCPDNFKYHKNKILRKDGNWLITENSWPYKNAAKHFLLVGSNHKENFYQLNKKDFESVRKLVNWAIKKFKIDGGSLNLRFGEPKLTGSTVCHIHFHLIVPKLTGSGKVLLVNFPIG